MAALLLLAVQFGMSTTAMAGAENRAAAGGPGVRVDPVPVSAKLTSGPETFGVGHSSIEQTGRRDTFGVAYSAGELTGRRDSGVGYSAAEATSPVAFPRSAPLGEYAATISFTVSTISPEVVTEGGGNLLTIAGKMTNTGPVSVGNLDVRFQRGDALTTVSEVRAELSAPSQPFAVLTQKATLAGTISAGATVPFVASIDIAGNSADALGITDRGVYPIMLNVNGDLGVGSDVFHARIGELHLLTTVLSVPRAPVAPPTAGQSPGSGTGDSGVTPSVGGPSTAPTPITPATTTPIPISMLWPVVDRPHLGVDGTFLDDALSKSISPGGRLAGVLDRLTRTDLGAGAVTLVIDPELLDELDRMSAGYRVVSAVGRPQPALSPATTTASAATPATAPATPATSAVEPTAAGSSVTSTGPTEPPATPIPAGAPASPSADSAAEATGAHHGASAGTTIPSPVAVAGNTSRSSNNTGAPAVPAGTVAGQGKQAAIKFLKQLREATARHPVLVLPYSDPDTIALGGAGMSAQVRALAVKGRQLATRVLSGTGGSPMKLLTTTAYPVGGLTDNAALAALADSGYRTCVLDASSVRGVGIAGAVRVPLPGGATMSAAIDDSDLLVAISAITTPAGAAAAAASTLALNGLAALMAEHSFDGSGTPLVLLPDRQWSATSWPGLATFAGLSRVLAGGKIVTGTAIDVIASHPITQASVGLPANTPAPLDAEYLARVGHDRDEVRQLGASLLRNQEGGGTAPDPADLLGTLDESFGRLFSSSLRSDSGPARSVLATIESTTGALRGGVSIRSSGQSYTLASSSSPLLLTVQNTLPYAVTIRVVITGGEQAGLRVTQPDKQLIPAGRSQQVRIQTQVSRSGSFAVSAVLVGSDGAPWSQQASQITVSSSAYGTVTIVIIVVAGAVLLLMVILQISQRWRSRKSRIAQEAREWAAPSDKPAPDSIMGSAEAEAELEGAHAAGSAADRDGATGSGSIEPP